MNPLFVIGSDPEIFVEHENGGVFPAFYFLGSQQQAALTPEEGMKYFWDGVQCECEVKASASIAEVVNSIRFGLAAILTAAKLKDGKARLSTQTVVHIPLTTLAKWPEEYYALGCSPSENFLGLSGKKAHPQKIPYRFSGGHIHLGIAAYPEAMNRVGDIICALDAILGVTCVSLFENFDNPIRRESYGLPSEFRRPPHGIEYRSLSNCWIFNANLAAMILDLARKVVVATVNGTNNWRSDTDKIIESMLCCDVDLARQMITDNMHCYQEIGFVPEIDLLKPIEESMPMDDIAKNWNI